MSIVGRRVLPRMVLGALLASGTTVADGRVLVTEGPGADVPVGEGRRLRVDARSMTLSIRAARQGEFRYEARSRDDRRAGRPVTLWFDGHTYDLERPAGATEPLEPLLLEIAVSPELALEVVVTDGRLQVASLAGGVRVRATDASFDGRALEGAVQVEAERATVRLESVAGSVSLWARETEARLQKVRGGVTVDCGGGSLLAQEIDGSFDAVLEATELQTKGVTGPARIQASGGSVELGELRAGAELALVSSPLVLDGGQGLFEVEADADVRFRGLRGGLVLDLQDAAVTGSGLDGSLTLRASHVRAAVEGVQGAVSLEGDEVAAQFRGVAGPMRARCASCTLSLFDAAGGVDIENDFGDVVIEKAAQEVKVTSRAGNVRALEVSGAVRIEADGEQVEIAWAVLADDADSSVANEGGDVALRIPPGGGCKLEARAPYGRIESAVPGLRVTDDGNAASGAVGGKNKPEITVRAGGDVTVAMAEPPATPAPGTPPPPEANQ